MRMSPWLVITAALVAMVYVIAPAQLEVAGWKLLLLSGAAYLGYWMYRHLYPYARPHELINHALEARDPRISDIYAQLAQAAMYCRAIIIAAVVLAAALAV